MITISSSNSDRSLTLYKKEEDYFSVKVTSLDCTGEVKVYSYNQSNELVKMFKEISEKQNGWKGEKSWSSLEEDFSLDISCDNLGHVYIKVNITTKYQSSPDPWELETIITTELGSLENIYKDIKYFLA